MNEKESKLKLFLHELLNKHCNEDIDSETVKEQLGSLKVELTQNRYYLHIKTSCGGNPLTHDWMRKKYCEHMDAGCRSMTIRNIILNLRAIDFFDSELT